MSDVKFSKKSLIGVNLLTFVTFAGILIGAIWTILQVYAYFNQKEEKLVVIGSHATFTVPSRFKDTMYNWKDLLSNYVKELATDKTSTTEHSRDYMEKFLQLEDNLAKRESNAQGELKALNLISTYRQIEVTNQGGKEAENISIELKESGGLYQIGEGLDAQKGVFTQSIPVGNLRPEQSLKIYIWSADKHYPFIDAFITHKNGSAKIVFPQDMDISTFTWTWVSYLSYILVALLILATGFGGGYLAGNKELRQQIEEEQKVINDFREKKKQEKSTSNTLTNNASKLIQSSNDEDRG